MVAHGRTSEGVPPVWHWTQAVCECRDPAIAFWSTKSDTVFEARKVQAGLRQGNLVEVQGVRPGEEVVTRGSFVLKSELQKDRIAGGED